MGNEAGDTRQEQEFACESPRKIQVSQQVREWQAEAVMDCTRRCILRAIELRFCAPVPADPECEQQHPRQGRVEHGQGMAADRIGRVAPFQP